MPTKLGPILSFRGCDANAWRVSALWELAESAAPPVVAVESASGMVTPNAPVALDAQEGNRIWRVDWSVPRGSSAGRVRYGLGGTPEHEFTVPGTAEPLRLAYASCNGFSDPKYMKQVDAKNERWSHMAGKHSEAPFHLLLMGGDQVYADSIWNEDSAKKVANWVEKRARQRIKAEFAEAMRTEVRKFYFRLYCNRWSQPEPAKMFASVPALMMWDDHDIFDGWGSYPPDMQACPVYRGIFEEARRAFRVFQLQISPDGDAPPGSSPEQTSLGYGHVVGTTAIAALDLRSERSQTQVMSPGSVDAALTWIDSLEGVRHLLVLSSIPVVYPSFWLLERALELIPGQQELEDDLRDHWTSRQHGEERVRLVHRLLRFAEAKRCRVTILSGDVHIGAVGVLESNRDPNAPANASVINQLVSSGIVHPPPPGVAQFFLKQKGDDTEEVDRGITARMLSFAGTDQKFIGARNWLSLSFDDKDRLWAEWWAEGKDQKPYTKVVHPIGW